MLLPYALRRALARQRGRHCHLRCLTCTQDVGYLAFFLGMHAVALVGGAATCSWEAAEVCLVGYVIIGMLGVSMSYHRCFHCRKPDLKSN